MGWNYKFKVLMDNVNFVEELIYNIHYDLSNIDILDPSEFVQRLLCFPCNGIQMRMLGIIRQAIHHFQNERSIMKYIYIIDKLIKVPNFLQPIHASIIQIYSDLFVFLLMQKCSTEIQELKILRKFWVGKLHPFCLTQIKEIILQRTNIDIDCGFKQETINGIRAYYLTKLNMGPQEMAFHLPTLKRNEEFQRYSIANQNNQRYSVEANNLYPQHGYHISYPPNFNNNPLNQGYSQSFQGNPQVNHQPSSFAIKNPNIPQNRMQMEMNHSEELKRKRLASEQTRVAGSATINEEAQPNTRKIQHKNEVIIDYKFMLSKLKRMNPFSCKECGIQLMGSESLEAHKGEHLKEKLSKSERNVRTSSKNGKLCSVQEWLSDKQDLTFSLDQFYISIPKQEIKERLCDFCCAPLHIDFRNNTWVYTNAALARINNRPSTIHKSCQIALETQYHE